MSSSSSVSLVGKLPGAEIMVSRRLALSRTGECTKVLPGSPSRSLFLLVATELHTGEIAYSRNPSDSVRLNYCTRTVSSTLAMEFLIEYDTFWAVETVQQQQALKRSSGLFKRPYQH